MSQQGQPVSVLLHTVGYLLLLHAPSYYSYYILGKWVTASIAPPSTIHSPIRLPSRHRYGSEYTFLRSGSQVNQAPPKSLQASHSIQHNTHILLPRRPRRFVQSLTRTFARGGSSDLVRRALGLNMEARGHEMGKNWLFSLRHVSCERQD